MTQHDDAMDDLRAALAAKDAEIARLTDANRKYAKALTEHQGSIDWREWMLVPVTECEFIPKAKHEAEIARLRDDLRFVERWAVHHAGKRKHNGCPMHHPDDILKTIAAYPAISEITEGYARAALANGGGE